jgi:macrolide-specific efflux system membrane fusion protein
MSAAVLLLAAAVSGGDVQTADAPIQVESVLLTLVEQVEVPAREAGVLANIHVREGQLVPADLVLALVEDNEAQLALARAKLEAAEAQRQAKNDVKIRLAKKTLEVARLDMKRADEARERFSKSISQSELDDLRLKIEKGELEIEQAEHEFENAGHLARVAANQLQLAERNLERRRIVTPVEGVVVKVFRHPGEWVEPGEVVLRLVRINPLRAEGFLDATKIKRDLSNQPVRLFVDLPGAGETVFAGKLVFVSPEIDPFNGQARVYAEVANRDLLLRPGMRARMEISTAPVDIGAAVGPVDGNADAGKQAAN